MKPKVLFVCIENSCRSQMAEGFAKKHGAGRAEVYSAGSKPSGKVNPRAIQFMKEKGIDLNVQQSIGLSDLPPVKWDYVFTMGCGDACPIVPSTLREDWDLEDPKNLSDDGFRKVRDDIEVRVLKFIKTLAVAT